MLERRKWRACPLKHRACFDDPMFSPELQRSVGYIGHKAVVRSMTHNNFYGEQ